MRSSLTDMDALEKEKPFPWVLTDSAMKMRGKTE